MNNQRVVSLAALAFLTAIAAGLLWRFVLVSQYVVEASTISVEPHIDQSADTLNQISEAMVIAKRDNKRVLLQFGSRGCSWCHLLHNVFETDARIAGELKRGYVVVQVDVSDGNNQAVDEKFGKPTRGGLPVTVILDSDGRQLLTKNIAFADEESLRLKTPRIDAGKVLACLKKWAPGNESDAN